jgi:hypothetical protein
MFVYQQHHDYSVLQMNNFHVRCTARPCHIIYLFCRCGGDFTWLLFLLLCTSPRVGVVCLWKSLLLPFSCQMDLFSSSLTLSIPLIVHTNLTAHHCRSLYITVLHCPSLYLTLFLDKIHTPSNRCFASRLFWKREIWCEFGCC